MAGIWGSTALRLGDAFGTEDMHRLEQKQEPHFGVQKPGMDCSSQPHSFFLSAESAANSVRTYTAKHLGT